MNTWRIPNDVLPKWSSGMTVVVIWNALYSIPKRGYLRIMHGKAVILNSKETTMIVLSKFPNKREILSRMLTSCNQTGYACLAFKHGSNDQHSICYMCVFTHVKPNHFITFSRIDLFCFIFCSCCYKLLEFGLTLVQWLWCFTPFSKI